MTSDTKKATFGWFFFVPFPPGPHRSSDSGGFNQNKCLMKLAKIYLDEFSFGTHMISTEGHWNGFVMPFVKEGDMIEFASKVRDAFFESSEYYDLLERVDDEWVWNEYSFKDGKSTLELTLPISYFVLEDNIAYYDIQIGHAWEVEEGA